MRQILFDELTSGDASKLDKRLKEFASPSSMEGLYWVEIPKDLLDPGQFETEKDYPFCFAVELGEDWVKFELLIRSLSNMQSLHIRYANQAQRKYILDLATNLIDELDIKT